MTRTLVQSPARQLRASFDAQPAPHSVRTIRALTPHEHAIRAGMPTAETLPDDPVEREEIINELARREVPSRKRRS